MCIFLDGAHLFHESYKFFSCASNLSCVLYVGFQCCAYVCDSVSLSLICMFVLFFVCFQRHSCVVKENVCLVRCTYISSSVHLSFIGVHLWKIVNATCNDVHLFLMLYVWLDRRAFFDDVFWFDAVSLKAVSSSCLLICILSLLYLCFQCFAAITVRCWWSLFNVYNSVHCFYLCTFLWLL